MKFIKSKQKQKLRSPCSDGFEYLRLLDSVCLRGLHVLSQGSTKRVKGHIPPHWVCEDKEHPESAKDSRRRSQTQENVYLLSSQQHAN